MQLIVRRFASVLSAALVMACAGVCLQSSFAQEAQGAGAQTPGQGQGQGPRRGGGNGAGAVRQALRAVKPTQEQQDKIKTLTEKMREDMKALQGQNLKGAERREKQAEMTRKFIADVEAVLTPEQLTTFRAELKKAQAEGGNGGNALMNALEPLNLTAEQKTKVEPIVKETQEQMTKVRTDQSLEGPARMQKMTQIMDDFRAKVRPLLTPDQQTKLDEIKFGGGGGRRNRGNGGADGNAQPQ